MILGLGPESPIFVTSCSHKSNRGNPSEFQQVPDILQEEGAKHPFSKTTDFESPIRTRRQIQRMKNLRFSKTSLETIFSK
jgi:hypothetical protein